MVAWPPDKNWYSKPFSNPYHPVVQESNEAVEASKKRKTKEAKVVYPEWMKSKPRTKRQQAEAIAYCKAKGIDPPWLQ
jgi:hypothetical protein